LFPLTRPASTAIRLDRQHFLILAAFLLVAAAGCLRAEPKTTTEEDRPLVPEHYLVHLEPQIEHGDYEGAEEIQIQIRTPSQSIVLNVADLDVFQANLRGNGLSITLRLMPQPEHQALELAADEVMEPGTYRLGLRFRGKLHPDARGLYLIASRPPGTADASILVSESGPNAARAVFPCFDDPQFRATFQFSIRVERSWRAVANVPPLAEVPVDGASKIVVFGESPPTPTHLLGLICGKFGLVEEENGGTHLRFLTQPGKEGFARYALQASKQLLRYYEEYFGPPLGVPELDQVALPERSARAMAGWGLVAYPEEEVLLDGAELTAANQQRVFRTVAFRLAQQWVGGLVGFVNWDEAWLSDGLAAWMELKATESFHPEWKSWMKERRQVDELMLQDAGEQTRPVQDPARGFSSQREALEEPARLKAECLLRMVEAFVGDAPFHEGMRSYIASYQQRSVHSREFWSAIDAKANRPVANWAERWFIQPGLPLLKLTSQCVVNRRVISLEQTRFTLNEAGEQSDNAEQWTVPVGILNVAPGEPARYALLEKLNDNFESGTCETAIKANPGDLGYYRVWYEPTLVADLEKRADLLSEVDRINLLSDLFATVRTRRVPISVFMGVADRWHDDASLGVSRFLLDAFLVLDHLEARQRGREAFQAYVSSLLRPRFDRLGWQPKPGEAVEDSLQRAELIEALGRFGDRSVIDGAFHRFQSFHGDQGAIDPSLWRTVLQIVGQYASPAIFEQLEELEAKEPTPALKAACREALEGALDPELAGRLLDSLALSRPAHAASLASSLARIADRGEHADLVWKFLENHSDLLHAEDLWRNGELFVALTQDLGFWASRRETLSRIQTDAGLPVPARLVNALTVYNLDLDAQGTIVPALDDWITHHSP
jgi:aminopeptidase N